MSQILNISDLSNKKQPLSSCAVRGRPGLSAYEVAVLNGFSGTEEEWLASLKGDKGDAGETGTTSISMSFNDSGTGISSPAITTTMTQDIYNELRNSNKMISVYARSSPGQFAYKLQGFVERANSQTPTLCVTGYVDEYCNYRYNGSDVQQVSQVKITARFSLSASAATFTSLQVERPQTILNVDYDYISKTPSITLSASAIGGLIARIWQGYPIAAKLVIFSTAICIVPLCFFNKKASNGTSFTLKLRGILPDTDYFEACYLDMTLTYASEGATAGATVTFTSLEKPELRYFNGSISMFFAWSPSSLSPQNYLYPPHGAKVGDYVIDANGHLGVLTSLGDPFVEDGITCYGSGGGTGIIT